MPSEDCGQSWSRSKGLEGEWKSKPSGPWPTRQGNEAASGDYSCTWFILWLIQERLQTYSVKNLSNFLMKRKLKLL